MWFPRNITLDEKKNLIWLWDELERSRMQRVLSWRLRQSSHTPSLDRRVYLGDITHGKLSSISRRIPMKIAARITVGLLLLVCLGAVVGQAQISNFQHVVII